MLSFGDRNIPIDGNAVRRDAESCVAQTDIHWVSAQPTGMFQCCFLEGGDHPGSSGALIQHYLGPPHCLWHGYFTGGGVRLSSCCSALLPAVLACIVAWCSHSPVAEVPVCWGGSPLPLSSEGLALFSVLLLPESV